MSMLQIKYARQNAESTNFTNVYVNTNFIKKQQTIIKNKIKNSEENLLCLYLKKKQQKLI